MIHQIDSTDLLACLIEVCLSTVDVVCLFAVFILHTFKQYIMQLYRCIVS